MRLFLRGAFFRKIAEYQEIRKRVIYGKMKKICRRDTKLWWEVSNG
jgi:hypothetical protein